MAELKTKKTELSVDAFIKKIPDTQKRKDASTIVELMEKLRRQKRKCGDLPLSVLATVG